jgi:hypothetical protein
MSKCVGFFIGKNGVECRVIDRFWRSLIWQDFPLLGERRKITACGVQYFWRCTSQKNSLQQLLRNFGSSVGVGYFKILWTLPHSRSCVYLLFKSVNSSARKNSGTSREKNWKLKFAQKNWIENSDDFCRTQTARSKSENNATYAFCEIISLSFSEGQNSIFFFTREFIVKTLESMFTNFGIQKLKKKNMH